MCTYILEQLLSALMSEMQDLPGEHGLEGW